MIRPRSACLLALSFAVFMLSFVGCGGGGPTAPSEAQLIGREAQRFLIAPLNVASSLPPEIEGSSKIVMSALIEHLESHGKTVQQLRFKTGHGLWIAAIGRVAAENKEKNFRSAAQFYAQEIAKQVEYDLLIIPTLYIQNARVGSKWAKWDDAKERITMKGRLKGNKVFDRMTGGMFKAASIMTAVYTPAGEEIQTKKRGLQLIEHIQISRGKGVDRNTNHWKQVMNQPAMENKDLVLAGVAAALYPLVPREKAVEPASNDESAKSE